MTTISTESAPRTMMLADLDGVLRDLLDGELAASGLHGVAITFEAPSRDRTAEWQSPAINVFLYDLREASDLKDRSWQDAKVDGQGVLVRPPLRLDCTYAITAWTQNALDEHRLLSQVVAVLCAHPQLPVELLPPSLLVGDPPHPLPTRVAHVRDDGRAEFWTAVGGQYKVSLELTVTILCDPGVVVARGPAVTTEVLTTSTVAQAGGGPSDAAFAAGGEVRDPGGSPLAGVAITIPALGLASVTASDGTFVLRTLPAGEHTVQARGAAGQVVTGTMTVPGERPLVLVLPTAG